MAEHEEVGNGRPGRKSGIRRLVYRPTGTDGNRKGGSGARRTERQRDWSAIKDQLRLTVRRAPEVVINVKGSRRGSADDTASIEGVLRYMMYISRAGRLASVNEKEERIDGREAVRETHASWDLDMQRLRGGKGEALHPAFNIIFSMPAATDPDEMLASVQAFAHERFRDHQYVMTLHTRDTDPADDPPAHPHVHLILRAEDGYGKRIYIRKADLRGWREAFAAELRSRGIEANATARAERGVSLKSKSAAEWHSLKRFNAGRLGGKNVTPPTALAARLAQAARELQEGRTEQKPWEIAMAARRRDVVRKMSSHADRLREEGDHLMADRVDRFVAGMGPVDSERRQMQRALAEQLMKRIERHDPEKSQAGDGPELMK